MNDNDTDNATDGHSAQGDQLRHGAKQMADGAAQVASGAKVYVDESLAPAAKQAASTIRERIGARTKDAGGPLAFALLHAPRVIPTAAIAAGLGVFLPMTSHRGLSISYMSMDGADGPFLVIALAVALGIAVLNLKRHSAKKGLRLAAGIAAAAVGIIGMVDGFGNVDVFGWSIGAFLIGLASLVLTAAGALTALRLVGANPNRDEPVSASAGID